MDRERIKAEGQIAKLDGQMQLKQFMFMVSLLKPLLTQTARQPLPEIEEEGETIDLDAIRSWH